MRPDGSKSMQVHPEFMAAVQDAETYEATIACAKGQGWPATTVVNTDVATLTETFGKTRPPSILLVDVDGVANATQAIAQLIKVCAGRSKILAVGSANDVPFYRGMIQAGAADYLVKPLNSIILRDSIMPLMASVAGLDKADTTKKSGKLYVVIGVRGGVGATTIAVNTAWVMAHEMNIKTALLDLDLQFGNCDLSLDLEPGRGLREVLANPDRMDGLLVNSAMAKESEMLSVFCSEESAEEVIDYDTAGPVALIRELRKDYDAIVLDLPRSLVPRHRRLLATADHILLASDMTLVGIRDVQRIMMAIANLGAINPITVVATHVNDGEPQIKRGDFESNIKSKIRLFVPHEPKAIKISANKGKSVLAIGSDGANLAKSYRAIASALTGEAVAGAQSQGGGLLSSLFKK